MQNERNIPRRYGDYTVAVICATGFEMSAVRYMLDREHPRMRTKQGDSNIYILTSLPGNRGKGAAAMVATNMARTFPSIKWRLLVGIGGGVSSGKRDIRLGDVVISIPDGQHGGVVQYDLGKDTEDGFQLKGYLAPAPPLLRSAAGVVQSDHLVRENKKSFFRQCSRKTLASPSTSACRLSVISSSKPISFIFLTP